jgi:hypothetical protein
MHRTSFKLTAPLKREDAQNSLGNEMRSMKERLHDARDKSVLENGAKMRIFAKGKRTSFYKNVGAVKRADII